MEYLRYESRYKPDSVCDKRNFLEVMAMDLILTNGNIYTMDRQTPKAHAVAMKNGIIEFVDPREVTIHQSVIDYGDNYNIKNFEIGRNYNKA